MIIADLTNNYMSLCGLTGSGNQLTEENMSIYAKNNGIRIYSIAFADTMSSGGRKTMSVLANATGGKYYEASATNIADVYKTIAGELQDTAGVNTTMTTDFQNVNITGVSVPGTRGIRLYLQRNCINKDNMAEWSNKCDESVFRLGSQ